MKRSARSGGEDNTPPNDPKNLSRPDTTQIRPTSRDSVDRGERIVISDELTVEIVGRGEFGERTVKLSPKGEIFDVLERAGHVPLPPYIRRPDTVADRERYQTVFANLLAAGFAANSYSATFTVVAPEPGPTELTALGLGFVLLSSGLRRKLGRR